MADITIAIQIGNSDDKLTQREWAEFVAQTRDCVDSYSSDIHFFGGSNFNNPWQNAAIICIVREDLIEQLRIELIRIRKLYKQDSIAWSECKTEFI